MGGNINAYLPSFRYVVKRLLQMTMKRITNNEFYVESYSKTYLYKAKHFSLIPLGLDSTKYTEYSKDLFQRIKSIVKGLLDNNINLLTDNNTVFSLETFMDVVDNYGCIVLNTETNQKDKIMQLLSGATNIINVESKNINKEINYECLLIQINNRISLILYICEDILSKVSLNDVPGGYDNYITSIQDKYMYILNTLDSSDNFVNPEVYKAKIIELQQKNIKQEKFAQNIIAQARAKLSELQQQLQQQQQQQQQQQRQTAWT
jgi:hypothetical protein